MIIKNKKWYIVSFLMLLSIIVIPTTFSKYIKSFNKTITLSIKSNEKIAYLKSYDGNNNILGFDKTDITEFSRNTDLTKEEVLQKPGVELVSNTEEDDYKSKYEVYGWVEDNKLYLWSPADTIIYFHPTTMNAFYNMPNLIKVDLNGISTSKVENFSRWFSEDSSLTTIDGKINTEGLKLENKTSTRNVSFYSMFNNCKVLTTVDLSEFNTKNATDMESMFRNCFVIDGLDVSHFDTKNVKTMYCMFFGCRAVKKLDVSHFDTGNTTSLSGMFTECGFLRELDVSNFDTKNVISMGQMFYGCKRLTELDVSNFDTKKVKAFTSMFYGCSNLRVLDVSNFDTSTGTNMWSMFSYCSSLRIIVLGEKFDTSNVESMKCMFSDDGKLRVIYVKKDFDIGKVTEATDMFKTSTNIIGGFNTNYETSFDQDYIETQYAKISNENQNGYFTYYESINDIKYNVTYDLDGGTAENKEYHFIGDDYALNFPEKEGFVFVGWTGSNGNIPQLNVTIDKHDAGDKHYVAHYLEGSNEINIPGPCTFRGENLNIVGENCKMISGQETADYTAGTYINTNLYLFTEENKNINFEISFTIDSIDEYVKNNTIISSMYEAGTPWPGFVYRINTDTSKLQLRAGYNGNSNWEMPYTTQNVKIIRRNKILYYSIDGGDPIQTVNFSNYTGSFDYPLTIGAGLDENKNPRRYFKGTLSNISIKLY